MKILVIGGGISDEREVSLRSSKSVLSAAKTLPDMEVDFYDWEGSFAWLRENVQDYDVILPILHGVGGEDGEIQVFLESQEVCYLGSNSEVSKLCFDKARTRDVLERKNITLPRGKLMDLSEYWVDSLTDKPHVIKPNNGGSSIDTLVNIKRDTVQKSEISRLFSKHKQLLVEEFIDGTEATISILEERKLPSIEIIPPEGEIFDYNNKYNGATAELCPPKTLSTEMQDRIFEIASDTHDILGCRHLSRVDVIIRDDKIFVLELNTMPGMTDASLFPLAAKTAGIDMPQLVGYFVELCREDNY